MSIGLNTNSETENTKISVGQNVKINLSEVPILNSTKKEILYLEPDKLSEFVLAETVAKLILDLNNLCYFKYILHTVLGKGFGDRIKNSWSASTLI